MGGEAANVHFVDDKIFDRDVELAVAFPFEVLDICTGAIGVGVVPVVSLCPGIPPANALGIRIQQDLPRVKSMTLGRIVRSIKAESVLDPGCSPGRIRSWQRHHRYEKHPEMVFPQRAILRLCRKVQECKPSHD